MDLEGIDDIQDELDLTIYEDQAELIEVVVEEILAAISFGLEEKKRFDLVLTGGTLGIAISQALIADFNTHANDYAGLHIWFSDERFVDSPSTDRNCHPFHEGLTNSNIHIHEALSPDTPATVEEAVKDYQSQLKGVSIDLNILGVGPDGHVASLFPGVANLDDTRDIFAITDSPKPPASRISFTMSFINQAREVWIVAAGESKADAVAMIVEGDLHIPASYVSGRERTRLIVDQAAFMGE
jgi:6-phosphogluconolactonase